MDTDDQPSDENRPLRPSPVVDWSVLRLFNHYRIFLLIALGVVYYLAYNQRALGQRDADLFEVAHLGYAVLSLGFIYLIRLRKPSVDTQFYLQIYLDIIMISLLMYASGGIQSGLGPLMVINIALLSQLTGTRHAMLFAAIATTVLLSEELFARYLFGRWAADFERTALLGGLLFLVAWFISGPLQRLLQRTLPSATAMRAALDARQLATLNTEIIQELDSGVLVVDPASQVILINDTARTLLSAEFSPLPIPLKQVCPNLHLALREHERQLSSGNRAFTVEATGLDILPQFIDLSSGGTLIKIDDHGNIRQQFQQLKLASLGRLSASIAHEIRNPLGAIGHAIQLLEESERLDAEDRELLTIANRHTGRINRIVSDILQLSNQPMVRQDPIDIAGALQDFCTRFRSEHELDEARLSLSVEPGTIAYFDPVHLDQVLWNLCLNALLHNDDAEGSVSLSLSAWSSQRGVTVIDVIDDGKGISDLNRAHLFEPFYSTHNAGSGLGLFIIRELCELNKASIDCVEREQGAHFRITLSGAQEMAA